MTNGAILREMQDIAYIPSFSEALAASRASGRPVLVVPLGQGLGPEGDW